MKTSLETRIEGLTMITKRSKNQTELLLDLVGGNFFKLVDLEMEIIKRNIGYCPRNEKEINELLEVDCYLVYDDYEQFTDEPTITYNVKAFKDLDSAKEHIEGLKQRCDDKHYFDIETIILQK